jgi:hypothetical protein
MSEERAARVSELERRIADLEARLPKHSVPARMLIQLEELEEALERARSEAGQENQQ